MEGYRELLYKKASNHLPNFPKGPNDFYVAILPHNVGVRSCEVEDFLWLKVKGTTAVAKIRKAHSKRIGTDILLVDGTEVAKDDAQVQSLDHFGSELVVFWSVVDDGRVPLKEASAKQQNVRRGKPEKLMPAKLESVELDLEKVKLEPKETKVLAISADIPPIVRVTSTVTLNALKQALEKLRNTHPNILFKVLDDSGTPQIRCTDCPNTQFRVPHGEYLSSTVLRFSQHLATEEHTSRLQRRVRLLLDLNRKLRHRFHDSGLHIPKTGTSLLPEIKCELCLKWKYKVVDRHEVRMLLSAAKKHLKSPEHPIEYKEADLEEHMASSPVCRMAAIASKHGNQLGQLRRRFPGSNLELRFGGVTGALISCQDCYVDFHIYPPDEVDFSTTVAKTDLHFATARHKTLAGRRVSTEKNKVPVACPLTSSMRTPPRSKKRPSPRTSLDELLTKLRTNYPHHKFKIHEPYRSAELRVLCADCPLISYSFLEDNITVAEATLVNHLKIHKNEKNKRPREERKVQKNVVVLDDDSEDSLPPRKRQVLSRPKQRSFVRPVNMTTPRASFPVNRATPSTISTRPIASMQVPAASHGIQVSTREGGVDVSLNGVPLVRANFSGGAQSSSYVSISGQGAVYNIWS